MIFKLFLLLFFNILNSIFVENKDDFLIKTEDSSFFSENFSFLSDDLVEKINIGYACENLNELIPECSIFSEIFKALKSGGEIKFFNIKSEKPKLKEIYKKLKEKNIYFYIVFFENEDFFSWKIYSTFDEKFLDGKNYSKKNKNLEFILELKRAICSDIWKILFGNEITPFDSFLAYSKDFYQNNKKFSEIIYTQPFFSNNEKVQIKTNRIIADLRVLNNEESSVITFSEITKNNVRIIKLKKNGNLSVIIDLPGTSTSLCSLNDSLFYVRSSNIYYCFYDYKKKRFVHEKIRFEKDYDSIIASVCEGPNNMLLSAKDYKIYKINFTKNKDGKIISTNEEILCPKNSIAMGVAYTKLSPYIITTEKVGKYYQLFSYDKDNFTRTQVTNSNYSKNEISISPCGTYVAYTVTNSSNKKKRIEIINLYTKKTKKITEEDGRYISPVWILRKI